MTNEEAYKEAVEVRSKIAKAVFDDKVSTRDIDEVEHKIIAEYILSSYRRGFGDGIKVNFPEVKIDPHKIGGGEY